MMPELRVADLLQELEGQLEQLDVKTLRRLCQELGEAGLGRRGEVSLAGDEEQLAGGTLVIGIDGRAMARAPAQTRP